MNHRESKLQCVLTVVPECLGDVEGYSLSHDQVALDIIIARVPARVIIKVNVICDLMSCDLKIGHF